MTYIHVTITVCCCRWHLKFIQSDFKGQLPKPYSSHPNATSIIPTHMNDMNKEEPSRYVRRERERERDRERERETDREITAL